MNKTELNSDLFIYSLLYPINERIKDWDLAPLAGKGLFHKHLSTAYLALRIYPSLEAEQAGTYVIWNVPDHPVVEVHPAYKADIEQNLVFFVRYIAALRGEVIQLTFEINELAFDETCTRHHPFKAAAFYALVNCFGHELSPFSSESVGVLKQRNALYSSPR